MYKWLERMLINKGYRVSISCKIKSNKLESIHFYIFMSGVVKKFKNTETNPISKPPFQHHVLYINELPHLLNSLRIMVPSNICHIDLFSEIIPRLDQFEDLCSYVTLSGSDDSAETILSSFFFGGKGTQIQTHA